MAIRIMTNGVKELTPATEKEYNVVIKDMEVALKTEGKPSIIFRIPLDDNSVAFIEIDYGIFEIMAASIRERFAG